ncbi:MAG: DoxX family protein [Chitinophagaceae bacterium]
MNSKTKLYTSYILQGLLALLFLSGAINNILQTESAIKGAEGVGYPASSVLYLGIILLVSTILYIIPRTMVMGAILLTAWLGGAVATHFIHQDALLFKCLPVVFGVLMWFSVWLRNEKLQEAIS